MNSQEPTRPETPVEKTTFEQELRNFLSQDGTGALDYVMTLDCTKNTNLLVELSGVFNFRTLDKLLDIIDNPNDYKRFPSQEALNVEIHRLQMGLKNMIRVLNAHFNYLQSEAKTIAMEGAESGFRFGYDSCTGVNFVNTATRKTQNQPTFFRPNEAIPWVINNQPVFPAPPSMKEINLFLQVLCKFLHSIHLKIHRLGMLDKVIKMWEDTEAQRVKVNYTLDNDNSSIFVETTGDNYISMMTPYSSDISVHHPHNKTDTETENGKLGV